MARREYNGLLAIGDPHIEARVPGFRKDDYPNVILNKLRWCFAYARDNSLLPVILGDLFHLPRDNPNWVLCELIDIFSIPAVAIYGNHDCRENAVNENDSLSVLNKAGRLKLLNDGEVWRGQMAKRDVFVGGTPWGKFLPDHFTADTSPAAKDPLVFWLAHHDVKVPGYEEQGHFRPREIPGIDVILNGHIHRHLQEVVAGQTLWLTPGSISRRNRGDATREHLPAALRIDVDETGWRHQSIEVPHESFDAVFYPEVIDTAEPSKGSAFVAGLAELQSRKTELGAGLMNFLEKNLPQFEAAVADEILTLAKEVTEHAEEQNP